MRPPLRGAKLMSRGRGTYAVSPTSLVPWVSAHLVAEHQPVTAWGQGRRKRPCPSSSTPSAREPWGGAFRTLARDPNRCIFAGRALGIAIKPRDGASSEQRATNNQRRYVLAQTNTPSVSVSNRLALSTYFRPW